MFKEGQYGKSSWGDPVEEGTFAFPHNSDQFLLVSPLPCSVDSKEIDKQLASYFTRITQRAREKFHFIVSD